jgi:hypothetical protein
MNFSVLSKIKINKIRMSEDLAENLIESRAFKK